MIKEKRLCMGAFILMICAEYLALLNPGAGSMAMVPYRGALALIFFGFTLNYYGKRWEHWAGVAIVVWYGLCRILMADFWMMRDHSNYSASPLVTFFSLCCAYGLYYPFARITRDGEKFRMLRIAVWMIGAFLGVFACLAIFSVVTGQEIVFPVFATKFFIYENRLNILHPNTTAAMFLVGFVLVIWASMDNRRLLPLSLVLGVLFFVAIAMTMSRTVMIQLALALGMLTGLWCLKKLSNRPLIQKWALALLAGVAVMAAAYLLLERSLDAVNGIRTLLTAPAVPAAASTSAPAAALTQTAAPAAAAAAKAAPGLEQRPIMDHLATLTGRTDIFRACIQMLRDHPQALLVGFYDWAETLSGYSDHAHNAYLQIVLQMGLPGLVISLWLTWRSIRAGVRVALSRDANLAEQFLCILPIVFLLNTITEPFLFGDHFGFYNHMYLLLLGYAMEVEHRCCAGKKAAA